MKGALFCLISVGYHTESRVSWIFPFIFLGSDYYLSLSYLNNEPFIFTHLNYFFLRSKCPIQLLTRMNKIETINNNIFYNLNHEPICH